MLRQADCVYEYAGLSSGSFEVPTGQSVLIKQFYAPFPTENGYVKLHIDRKTVGYWRVKGKSGNHIDSPHPQYLHQNLMEYLAECGVNVAIPVAEGQTFSWEYTAGNAHTYFVYDLYDAGDIHSNMPNGSDSKKYTFIQYMDASSYPSTSSDVHLDVSLSPSEFLDFPCGRVVPPRHTVKLIGLVGSPVGDAADAGNYIVTDYCKLLRDREVMFDTNRLGFPFRNGGLSAAQVEYTANVSMIHSCTPLLLSSGLPTYGKPLIFDTPPVFKTGEELLIKLVFRLVGAKTLTAGAIDFACILEVTVD